MKMFDQNAALSNTPKALLSLFLIILTCCFDLSNKYVYRDRTTFSFFAENAQIFQNSENKKSPYRFVPYLHPENSNGRCSGTILTGNTCVTVPVIGGGVFSVQQQVMHCALPFLCMKHLSKTPSNVNFYYLIKTSF